MATKTDTRGVGAAFRNAETAQGHGSIRCEARMMGKGRRGAVGYSYREPVAIHDGRNTLRSIRSWSVTTAGHIGTLYGPGETLPATTRMLRDVAAGRMTFKQAEKWSRAALAKDAERRKEKGVPVEAFEAGYRPQWSYRAEDAYVYRSGKVWLLRVGAGTKFTEHRTLGDARRAMWDRLGLTPVGEWHTVTDSDFPEVARREW